MPRPLISAVVSCVDLATTWRPQLLPSCKLNIVGTPTWFRASSCHFIPIHRKPGPAPTQACFQLFPAYLGPTSWRWVAVITLDSHPPAKGTEKLNSSSPWLPLGSGAVRVWQMRVAHEPWILSSATLEREVSTVKTVLLLCAWKVH